MVKKVITGILLLIILCRFGWLVYQNRNKYIPDYWQRYPTLKSVYSQSQYMMKNWKYWIPDETGYAYAGGAYILGASPILIESTQPPLGKYIIGLSIVLTGNENIAILFFFIFLMVGIYLLVFTLTRSSLAALLTVLASLFEGLFTDQLTYTPLLDILQITFILYAILTAAYAIRKGKPQYILATYTCLGAAMMTKVWVVASVFAIPITIYILISKWKYYPYIVAGAVAVVGITLITYTRLFFDHYNVIQVLKVQKWLYWYHSSKINRFFSIWPLIFLNRWYIWWGENPISKDLRWSLSWPITIGGGLIASVLGLISWRKKIESATILSAASVICYSLFMSSGQASARYLLPILPLCYALTAWMLYTIVKRIEVFKKIL